MKRSREGTRAGETILGLAKKHGVHQRMVREPIASSIPPERMKHEREQPKLDAVKEAIDRMLESDRQAPAEAASHGVPDLDTAVRGAARRSDLGADRAALVQRRKQELGLSGREVLVPQSYDWGEEGQVDWYEAPTKLGGEACKLQLFAMRSMASGDAFHQRQEHNHLVKQANTNERCCCRKPRKDSHSRRFSYPLVVVAKDE